MNLISRFYENRLHVWKFGQLTHRQHSGPICLLYFLKEKKLGWCSNVREGNHLVRVCSVSKTVSNPTESLKLNDKVIPGCKFKSMMACRDSECNVTRSSNLSNIWSLVLAQLHGSAALTPVPIWKEGWLGPRTGVDTVMKRKSSPVTPIWVSVFQSV